MDLLVKPKSELTIFRATGTTQLGGEIDASNCTKLTVLDCQNQDITSLNTTNCIALTDLIFNNNLLTSFNFLDSMVNVTLNNNNLTQIKAANKSNLYFLNAESNNISTVELTNCTSLYSILLNNNNVSSLDVSTCTNLRILNLDNNNIQGNLTGLGIITANGNASTVISVKNNNMSTEDLNNLFVSLPTKPVGVTGDWTLYIHDNIGTCNCDFATATDKGWTVYPQLYNLSVSSTSCTAMTFTLKTSIKEGTVNYTITGVSSSDINNASLTGSFTVSNYTASKSFTSTINTTQSKTMVLSINDDAACVVQQSVDISTSAITTTGCNYVNSCTCCDRDGFDGCPSPNNGDPCYRSNGCWWVCGGCDGGTQYCHGTVVSTTNVTCYTTEVLAQGSTPSGSRTRTITVADIITAAGGVSKVSHFGGAVGTGYVGGGSGSITIGTASSSASGYSKHCAVVITDCYASGGRLYGNVRKYSAAHAYTGNSIVDAKNGYKKALTQSVTTSNVDVTDLSVTAVYAHPSDGGSASFVIQLLKK